MIGNPDRIPPEPENQTQQTRPQDDQQSAPPNEASYAERLYAALNGDTSKLERLTAYQKKETDQKTKKEIMVQYPGRKSFKGISEAWAKSAFHKWEKEQAKKHSVPAPQAQPEQREPGQDDDPPDEEGTAELARVRADLFKACEGNTSRLARYTQRTGPGGVINGYTDFNKVDLATAELALDRFASEKGAK
jgi:hypothetical protein